MSAQNDVDRPDRNDPPSLSRRTFLKAAGGVAAAGGLVTGGAASQDADREQSKDEIEVVRGRVPITLTINGEEQRVEVEPRTTLLSALRHHLGEPLTGTKLVCDMATCGACTVLLDDRPIYSCTTLALDAVGRKIRTIEGIGRPGELSPVQEAFWSKDAQMCGFCTPGFVVSITACLERDPAASREKIERACAGNLCRCGTHPHIVDAALQAQGKMREGGR